MRLEDLTTGRTLSITVDRGVYSCGCRLDRSALTTAETWIVEALRGDVDALIVNKFGKEKSAGKGLSSVIAEAYSRGVPVLLGLAELNREAAFRVAGEAAAEFVTEAAAMEWLCRRIDQEAPA